MYMKVLAHSVPILGLGSILSCGCVSLKMPGESYQGELPPLSARQASMKEELENHVRQLSETIGERNLMNYTGLERAADYIVARFQAYGYNVDIQEYTVPAKALRSYWDVSGYEKQVYKNITAELKGTDKSDEIIVVGAHYDSVPVSGCKAANDNASGVAAILELAKNFARTPQSRTIRFVGFTNEEPPFFWTKYMGSYVYAKECKSRNENITAMLTPETIGCYSDEKGSQRYPFPLSLFYPSEGNFIAFVANSKSRELTRQCVKTFRENARFPSMGACLPMVVPRIGSSDHWSFWQMGYPALMITDTAPYRYRHYHKTSDNPENMDFAKMARVVNGLEKVITDIANP